MQKKRVFNPPECLYKVYKVVVKQDFTGTFVSSGNSAAPSHVHSHIGGLNFEL